MRALSIRQPWAWLITTGHKDVENRTWPSRFRGVFLIHAGKQLDLAGYRRVQERMGVALPQTDDLPRGGIVGSAEVVDCVRHHSSRWFSGPYGFVLANARPLPFTPLPGKLGFFPVSEELLQTLETPADGRAASKTGR